MREFIFLSERSFFAAISTPQGFSALGYKDNQYKSLRYIISLGLGLKIAKKYII
jgi:hypothetical protein